MLQAHKTYYITTKGCLFSFGRKLEASLHRKIIYPMKKIKNKKKWVIAGIVKKNHIPFKQGLGIMVT